LEGESLKEKQNLIPPCRGEEEREKASIYALQGGHTESFRTQVYYFWEKLLESGGVSGVTGALTRQTGYLSSGTTLERHNGKKIIKKKKKDLKGGRCQRGGRKGGRLQGSFRGEKKVTRERGGKKNRRICGKIGS